MKRFLSILAIFCGLLFLTQQGEPESCTLQDFITSQEQLLLDENDLTDLEHQVTIISKDLKNSNCLTPRRTAGSISNLIHPRSVKTLHKLTEQFRIKGINDLKKISEKVITCQTINFISLLARNGYHVFGLRKLII